MPLKEGAAHPCYAENRHHGIHARCKHVALHSLTHISLAHQQYQGGNTHHDDFDGCTHVQRIAVESGAQFREDAKQHHHHHSQQESHYRPLGTRIAGCRLVGVNIVVTEQPLLDAPQVFRVFIQRLAHIVLYQ